MKKLDVGFGLKNFSCTYSLFKVHHSIKSKIMEYGMILLHKYKVEQTKVISRLLSSLFFIINYKNVWSVRTYTFS